MLIKEDKMRLIEDVTIIYNGGSVCCDYCSAQISKNARHYSIYDVCETCYSNVTKKIIVEK